MKIISKLALLLTVSALLYLAISQNLLSASPLVIAGQLSAVALAVWARRSFQPGQFRITQEPGDGPLLTRGPYKVIRHPMYTAALVLVWASVLGHLSPINLAVAMAVTGVIVARVTTEERALRERFPGYAAYSRRTKRMVPFVI